MTGTDGEVDMTAFSLLSHELRLGILEAFFDRWTALDPDSMTETKSERGMSYSELMDAVGIEDSGKFNYHLQQLRGVYVEKVGEQYVPTASAIALYQTVLANRPTEMVERTTFDIGMGCPYCAGEVVGRYEQESLTVECVDCEEWWGLTYGFPKNGLRGRSGTDVLEALENRAMYDIGLARTGQCPACAGHTTVEMPRERLDGDRYPTAEFTCQTCSWVATIDVLNALRFVPQVSRALTEAGLFPEDEWGENGESDDGATTVTTPDVTGHVDSEDPFRVAITVETDDATVRMLVSDDLGVQSVSVEKSQ